MKSNMWKSTLREIKQSFGRFLAIFAITALGVSLFSGLKVIRPAMVETTEQYFEEKQFYDYRLLSTMGFQAEEVSFLAEQDGVRAVEGSVSFDVLCGEEEGTPQVFEISSLPETISRLELKAGRMPENAKECLADSRVYGEEDIGKNIVLSEDNEEDTLESFASREYTITGIAQSPNYIQMERGTTSVGNGKITGFFYVPMEGFDTDYFTEIFVKFDEDPGIFSDTYKDFIDQKEIVWEDLTQQAADQRYDRIVAEATEDLDEAKAEFEAEKKEAEADLAEAKAELDDAWKELKNSQKELEDGKQELADGRKALDENRKTLQKSEADLVYHQSVTLPAAEKELAEKRALLDQQAAMMENGQEILAEAYAQLEAGEAEIREGYAQAKAGEKQIRKGYEELAKAEQELVKGETELADAEKDLQDGWKEYEDGLAEYEEGYQEYLTEIQDAEAEIQDAEKEIADIERPETYLLGRETNVGYVCMDNDSSIVDGIANVFPFFFYAVAALVCITTMSRMIEEQRTQIGVLKALGYSKASIMGKYLFYSGLAAISGCIFGYFFGTWMFPKIIWFAYSSMYDVADIVYVFEGKLLIFSLIISAICSMGVTYISCRNELSEVAAELMRPKAPKAGKRVLLERVPFIWSRMKFLHKVSYRNVFRYKKRFFMMVVGISGCTGLLLTGFGVRDSISTIAEDQYGRILHYDLSVMLKDPVTEESSERIEEILGDDLTGMIPVLEKSVDLVSDHGVKSISMTAFEDGADVTEYIHLEDAKTGKTLEYPGLGECVLTNKMATEYDLHVGDMVTLRDDEYREMKLVLSGIAKNYLYNFVYLTAETYEEAMGEPAELTSVYVTLGENVEKHQKAAELMKEDTVVSASVLSDSKERFSSMIDSLDLLVVVIIICAGVLAFIVLYNLTNINITERIREIATIKVLGFYKNETASYIFRENLILTFIGALAGLALGKVFHTFVMLQVQVDQVYFDIHILPLSYIFSMILTFGFAVIVNVFMSRKLERVSMTESLKSVD